MSVAANPANSGNSVLGSFGADSRINDTYTLTILDGVNPGELVYEVRDSGAALVSSGNYSDGSSIKFAGVSLQISGTPAAGDSFKMATFGRLPRDSRNSLCYS